MKITLERIKLEQKDVLQQMLELYRYDFSEYDGSDLDEEGRYGYAYLDHYWREGNRYPFFIKMGGQYAGFVLISKVRDINRISEFFVLKKYRKKGIGKEAAFTVFDQFQGEWDIAQIPQNKAAQVFWTTIINEYTDGHFTDQISEQDQVRYQTFTSPPAIKKEVTL